MTVAVIPVKGRHPLVHHTIAQALKVVDKVICITDSGAEAFHLPGASDVVHVRRTTKLGKKWNTGFQVAKAYDPDHILFIGSSDWVSDNWMDYMLPSTESSDIVGVKSFNLLHLDYDVLDDIEPLTKKKRHSGSHSVTVKYNGLRLGLWPGYDNFRRGEPIGIGRVLNRDFLRRIDYKPFDDDKNKHMDRHMFELCKSYTIAPYEDIRCLSISTSLWDNMHVWHDDYEIDEPDFLSKWFPDAYQLTEWKNIKLLNTEIKWSVKDAY
jgi:hypothetical protein